MKNPKEANPGPVRIAISQEISRSAESRYHHRLHGLLLVISGLSCQQVADLFGEDRRTVQRWVKRFDADGLDGLRDGERIGRPASLTDKQWEKLRRDLLRRPKLAGDARPFRIWDGKLLAEHLRHKYGVSLGVRQCQRVLRALRHPEP